MLKFPSHSGFYVYILLCKGNTLYTGWTTDVKKRYEAHLQGKGAKYTKAHPPIACMYYEDCIDKRSAMKREYEIKQYTRLQKEALWNAKEKNMIEFRYDTQLLIEGENLQEDVINAYFVDHFQGDCLLAVGDDNLIKIHFHTNEPWDVLSYCATLGEIYDIVIEDMDRQTRGLKG